MATRSDIEARVAHYTSRDDIDFNIVIPQALDALDRKVRLTAQLEIIQYTQFADNPDAAGRYYYDLPADFNTVSFIDAASLSTPLDFLPPDQFFSASNSHTIRNRAYTILGKRLYLTTQSGDIATPLTFTLGYFRKLEALPNAQSTNALTEADSDVLVEACKVEAYKILRNSEEQQKAQASLDGKIEELEMADLRKRYDYRNLRQSGGRRRTV